MGDFRPKSILEIHPCSEADSCEMLTRFFPLCQYPVRPGSCGGSRSALLTTPLITIICNDWSETAPRQTPHFAGTFRLGIVFTQNILLRRGKPNQECGPAIPAAAHRPTLPTLRIRSWHRRSPKRARYSSCRRRLAAQYRQSSSFAFHC